MGNRFIDNFARVPVNRLFEYTLVSQSPESAVVSMDAKPEYAQEAGLVQGGVLSAIADTAAVYAFLSDLADDQIMTSVEFKMNFLRPVKPGDGAIVARSTVVRRGRTIGVCDVELTQSQALVAKGTFTYMFMPRNNQQSL
jgi:uncharacterized protein (TIGR00369 family)